MSKPKTHPSDNTGKKKTDKGTHHNRSIPYNIQVEFQNSGATASTVGGCMYRPSTQAVLSTNNNGLHRITESLPRMEVSKSGNIL